MINDHDLLAAQQSARAIGIMRAAVARRLARDATAGTPDDPVCRACRDLKAKTADEATIRARIEEAQIVYALPPVRLLHTAAGSLPPLVILDVASNLQRWAHQLDLAVCVNVEEVGGGRLRRIVRARGALLGWAVTVIEVTTIEMPPLAMVRRAHMGVL